MSRRRSYHVAAAGLTVWLLVGAFLLPALDAQGPPVHLWIWALAVIAVAGAALAVREILTLPHRVFGWISLAIQITLLVAALFLRVMTAPVG